MRSNSLLVALCLALVRNSLQDGSVNTPSGVINYKENWGYTDIRTNAHTFWWLYYVPTDTTRPLVLWLQGGPGADSTGFGNFEEIGPMDINSNGKNYTWLQYADLVFVDNPVGAGFSYVDDPSAYTHNVQDIATDLFTWAKDFFGTKHPEYQTRKFYIFCESYGGKMSAAFAKTLQDGIDGGTIKANLQGVALGDSWISAMDFVNSWGPYLHSMSYLDENQLAQAQAQAQTCQTLVDQGQWTAATNCWGDMENLIGTLTNGVSWYNVLKEGGQDEWSAQIKKHNSLKYLKRRSPLQVLYDNHVRPLQLDALSDFMNGPIRKKLGIIPSKVSFGAQSGRVFDEQAGDFMTPNYATVDNLLSRGVFVNVYVGQLDLICDVLGTEMWMDRLQWSDYTTFKTSPKVSFDVMALDNNYVDGFVKSYKNLQLWYILRGGHMVSHDSPWAALHVMQSIVQK